MVKKVGNIISLIDADEIRGIVRDEVKEALKPLIGSREPLISTKELSDAIGVSEQTILKKIKDGSIPCQKAHKRAHPKFRLSEVLNRK